jgi:hypothetical protein
VNITTTCVVSNIVQGLNDRHLPQQSLEIPACPHVLNENIIAKVKLHQIVVIQQIGFVVCIMMVLHTIDDIIDDKKKLPDERILGLAEG